MLAGSSDSARAGVTEEQIERLMSPIGLDLGARTPEETAISICAEIIARRTGRGAPFTARHGRRDPQLTLRPSSRSRFASRRRRVAPLLDLPRCCDRLYGGGGSPTDAEPTSTTWPGYVDEVTRLRRVERAARCERICTALCGVR
jgi:hypothetical protein